MKVGEAHVLRRWNLVSPFRGRAAAAETPVHSVPVERPSFGDILITDRFFVADQVSGIKLLVFCIQMRFLPEQKYLHLEVDCVKQCATVVIILC